MITYHTVTEVVFCPVCKNTLVNKIARLQHGKIARLHGSSNILCHM